VPATGNIAPKLLVDIYESYIRGDNAASLAAQRKLHHVRMALTLGTAPGGVKAALQCLGTPIGPSRSPVAPLPPDKMQKMKAALQAAGLM
jgi:4-hydroxy-tetrahydrodipicolinate synthase